MKDLRRDDEPRQITVQRRFQGALDEVLKRLVREKSSPLNYDIFILLNQALNFVSY